MKRKPQAIQNIFNGVCYSTIVEFLIPLDAIHLSLSCKDFIKLHHQCFNKISKMMVDKLNNKTTELNNTYEAPLSQEEKICIPLLKTLLRCGMIILSPASLYSYLFFLADSLIPTNHSDFFINTISPPLNCQASAKLLKITFLMAAVATITIGIHVVPRKHFFDNPYLKIRNEYSKKSKAIGQTMKAYQRFLEQNQQLNKTHASSAIGSAERRI